MDPNNISPELDHLDDELDSLEAALQPILHNVSDVATKLPLLDKAKLYVLMTYAIESMLFCMRVMPHIIANVNKLTIQLFQPLLDLTALTQKNIPSSRN